MTAPDFTVEFLAPETLAPSPGNFRRHPLPQKSALESSIEEHGWLSAPIVNKQTNRILDGHARVELALERGEATIPVRVVDVSEAQEKRILRMFDAIGSLAEIDTEALDRLIEEIDDAQLERLLGELSEPESGLLPEADPDAVPEQVETRCQPGDLWLLGEHRLLCGDCTDSADIERLLGRYPPRLLVTSPPYNQMIDQFRPSGMHKEHDWVAKVERLAYSDSLPEEEYQHGQRCALELWHSVMADGASLFYNHKNRYRDKRVLSPLEWLPGPFNWRQEIVWSRPGSVTQNARMFLPSDERIYWLYKGADFYFDDSTTVKSHSTVWEITPQVNKTHAVAFPVEIPLRCIAACSRPTDVVFDPYAGSGTTLIACEQTGRTGRCLEIDPKNVDVILARWEQATGQKARLQARSA